MKEELISTERGDPIKSDNTEKRASLTYTYTYLNLYLRLHSLLHFLTLTLYIYHISYILPYLSYISISLYLASYIFICYLIPSALLHRLSIIQFSFQFILYIHHREGASLIYIFIYWRNIFLHGLLSTHHIKILEKSNNTPPHLVTSHSKYLISPRKTWRGELSGIEYHIPGREDKPCLLGRTEPFSQIKRKIIFPYIFISSSHAFYVH